MKSLVFLAVICCYLIPSFMSAQAVSINTDGSSPHASAILDIQSTDKGILVPRVTSGQRLMINMPATGLLVYDTETQGFWFYNGNTWVDLAAGQMSDTDGDTKVQVEESLDEDMIRFDAGGIEAMIIDSIGRVGIGNGAPSARLHLTNGSFLITNNIGSTPLSGAGTRMMWIPAKKAFRAGEVSGSQWNDVSIGEYSFAVGKNNTASGTGSLVGGGEQNTASGTNTFIGSGFGNLASSTWASVGGGLYDTASALAAYVGGGQDNTASGPSAFVGGGQVNEASGHYSFVGGGLNNIASAPSSFIAGGYYNTSSANDAFVGGGLYNKTSGKGSFTGGGVGLLAKSYGEAVVGFYNTNYSPVSTTTFHSNDRLFVIGNGTDSLNRNNALTILKSGNTGIGTESPAARFSVRNGAVLFEGASGATPVSGAGARMMWIPDKKAFRAGEILGAQWDSVNIGMYSFVGGGLNNKAMAEGSFVGGGVGSVASGNYAFVAGGTSNDASGSGSFVAGGGFGDATAANAFIGAGRFNIASGESSFAGGGYENTVSGTYAAVVGGSNNIASGAATFVGGGSNNNAGQDGSFIGGGVNNSTTGYHAHISGGLDNLASGTATFIGGGEGLLARSFAEVVIGSFNTDYTPTSTSDFFYNDRLFVIGNGVNANNRDDALTVMKNGNIGINNSAPAEKLHISGGDLRVDGGEFQSWGPIVLHPDVDNGGDDIVRFLNSTGGENMRISETGLVGIGRVPTFNKLEVEGDASKTVPGDWIGNSDARLKKNIQAINPDDMLQKLLSLQGVTYEWNDQVTGAARPAGIQYGFTAQNIRDAFPELVSEDKLGFLQTAYGTYDAMLVESIRALNEKMIEQQKVNENLILEITRLHQYVKEVEFHLQALENGQSD